ncbi:unnamed protein product [Albugo candida]|uniref:Peroxisomal biogenesis factor 11 domain-containing protein n=1 Tax=Albugo candida TaxID=65357 RepID=A0A024G6M4_9STRA|nr:unnamed protein product [Albugo candida]|eukprot:CCI41955.1 unnamed protein product [Albugo candida]
MQCFESKDRAFCNAMLSVASTLEGRDKLTKLLQYGSRALAWYCFTLGANEIGTRLSNLYKATQQARKVFRLGKSALLYTKFESILEKKCTSHYMRNLELVQNCGMIGFLAYDNIIFASKANVLKVDEAKAVRQGGLLWFIANIAGFLRAADSLKLNVDEENDIRKRLTFDLKVDQMEFLQAQLDLLQETRSKNLISLLKITCDLVVSSNTSGVRLSERVVGKKLHDGIIGSVGCLSAILFLYNIWPKTQPKSMLITESTTA